MIDGFYVAYVTGKEGQGFALYTFRQGRFVGADAGGFLYDGTYTVVGNVVTLSALIKAPPNVPRIQGGITGPEGEEIQLKTEIPLDFANRPFVRIETPRGPVNASIKKIREIDD